MAQQEPNVGNLLFPVFRQTMNAIFGAIVSNFSGAGEPANPVPHQYWYDTANNIMKIRNQNGDGWLEVFSLNADGQPNFRPLPAEVGTTTKQLLTQVNTVWAKPAGVTTVLCMGQAAGGGGGGGVFAAGHGSSGVAGGDTIFHNQSTFRAMGGGGGQGGVPPGNNEPPAQPGVSHANEGTGEDGYSELKALLLPQYELLGRALPIGENGNVGFAGAGGIGYHSGNFGAGLLLGGVGGKGQWKQKLLNLPSAPGNYNITIGQPGAGGTGLSPTYNGGDGKGTGILLIKWKE